jgi:hypothetical protein
MLPGLQQQARKYRYRGFFGSIDVQKCPQTKEFYNVSAYPDLVYVRYGNRTLVGFDKAKVPAFVKKVLSPAVRYVGSFPAIQEMADRNMDFFLIGHKPSPEEERVIDEFTLTQKFYWSDAFPSFPFNFESGILYYRSADRQFVEVGKELSVSAITKFLVNGTKPRYREFSTDIVDDLIVENTFLILVKFEASRDQLGNADLLLLTALTEFQLSLCYFTAEHASIFNELINPPAEQETVVSVIRIVGDQTERWVHTNLSHTASDFVAGVLNGSVPHYLKSEEPPLDNSGPIRRVVGSTFASFTASGAKPCILLLYELENYALEVQMERLSETATELAGRALFGHLNTRNNEIPITIPKDLPAFIALVNGQVKVYGREVKASLTEWVRSMFTTTEL